MHRAPDSRGRRKSKRADEKPVLLTALQGLSLIELLVVIAIIGILAVLASSVVGGFTSQQLLAAGSSAAVSFIEEAHTEALAGAQGEPHGVHIDSSAEVLTQFTGASYTAGASSNRSYALSNGISIQSVSLAGAGSDIVFDQLTGDTAESGTIVLQLSADSSRTKTITISPVGVVHVQ